MRIDLSRIGHWTEEREFAVTPARAKAYAAATSDVHPRHRSGELAPPVFAVVPVFETIAVVMEPLVSREDRQWGVHASQDMHLYRPIRPGMVLRSRAAAIGAHPGRSGTAVVVKTETRDEAGGLVNEQYATLFFRGRTAAEGAGQKAPDHRTPAHVRDTDPLVSVADAIAADQTFRYAEASGDHSRIHLDAEFARSVGLPGIIVHGMCSMAFASRQVVATACGDDPARLRRLAVSFSRPVLPGQQITTQIWAAGQRDGRAVYAFTVLNPAGKAVIQDGLAEVVA